MSRCTQPFYTWDLVQELEVSIPSVLQDTTHIYWFYLLKQSTKKKQRIQKWGPTPNKLYSNPELRGIVLELSSRKGSDNINMLKQGKTQKEASCIIQPGLAYGSQHLERYTWKPVLRQESIGWKPWWAFPDCLKACILNSPPTKSHKNQPR